VRQHPYKHLLLAFDAGMMDVRHGNSRERRRLKGKLRARLSAGPLTEPCGTPTNSGEWYTDADVDDAYLDGVRRAIRGLDSGSLIEDSNRYH